MRISIVITSFLPYTGNVTYIIRREKEMLSTKKEKGVNFFFFFAGDIILCAEYSKLTNIKLF